MCVVGSLNFWDKTANSKWAVFWYARTIAMEGLSPPPARYRSSMLTLPPPDSDKMSRVTSGSPNLKNVSCHPGGPRHEPTSWWVTVSPSSQA